jgi:nitrate reductase delta subunit
MTHLYERLADLLEYPGDGWGAQLDLCGRQVEAEWPALAPALTEFCRLIEGAKLVELQERYTQSFDLNPVCALEIGYHLFGENYKRGLFLANLHQTESAYELGQQNQLPDYLPVLLRLLVKLDDAELKRALVAECLLPAIEKMLGALRQTDNPYGHLIEAVFRALALEAPRTSSAEFKSATAAPELYRISSRAARKEQRL